MLALIAAILPGVVLPAFKAWIGARNDAAARIADERMDARRQRAATIQAGMMHWPFWVAWSLFAWPLGLWWAAIVFDSIFLFSGNIPDLPESIRPWAETVFQNIFLPGAGVAAASIMAKGIARR